MTSHPALLQYSHNLTETGPAVLALMDQHLPPLQAAILRSLVRHGDQSAPELTETVLEDETVEVLTILSAMQGLFARRLVTREFRPLPVDEWSRG